MNYNEENLKKLFVDSIENNNLLKVVLSSLVEKKEDAVTKYTIKPIIIKEKIVYQIEYFRNNKAFHKNCDKGEVISEILEIYTNFKNINLFTTSCDYSILCNKGKFHVTLKNKEACDVKIAQHNKKKEYLIEEGTHVEFLVDLEVMDSSGKVLKNSYNKFRQINKYLEFIEGVIEELKSKKLIGNSMKIIDFGSGKSYLTFALYYYLHEIKKLEVEIVGLDLKKDVMMNCEKLSKKYKFENLKFIYGDIKDYEGFANVDMVFSLHACDTATDYSFLKGLELNAKAILAVPCCQHEFNAKIKSTKESGLKENLSSLTSHGILQEKLSSLLTDGFRAEVMELCGYKSKVIEFIDTEHTPKNLLIKCIIDKNMTKDYFDKKKIQCQKLIDFLGIEPLFFQIANKYFKYKG
ncbi:MAG: class I SAM-dependent methyltransferase [Fusobacteriaceae bacterium]